eukprot:3283673-Pyramimonas_sp.AAC.1
MACSECQDEIIYQATPWQPNRIRSAMDWWNAGMFKDDPLKPAATLHERGGRINKQKTRAVQMQNSDRTQARWREH